MVPSVAPLAPTLSGQSAEVMSHRRCPVARSSAVWERAWEAAAESERRPASALLVSSFPRCRHLP